MYVQLIIDKPHSAFFIQVMYWDLIKLSFLRFIPLEVYHTLPFPLVQNQTWLLVGWKNLLTFSKELFSKCCIFPVETAEYKR